MKTAAILAHEQSHVFAWAPHRQIIVSEMQKKTQALHEIGVTAKTALALGGASKNDKGHTGERASGLPTSRISSHLPAWDRQPGAGSGLDWAVDLLIRANYSPGAMVSVLVNAASKGETNQRIPTTLFGTS